MPCPPPHLPFSPFLASRRTKACRFQRSSVHALIVSYACLFLANSSSFAEVMTEYMEDVLQPRSRRSWDVLKAWFRVSTGGGSSTSTDPAATEAKNDSKPEERGDGRVVAQATDASAQTTSASDGAALTASPPPTAGGDDGAASPPPAPSPAPADAGSEDHSPRAEGGFGWCVTECKVGQDGTCESCDEVLRSIELSQDDEQRLLKQVRVVVGEVESWATLVWVGEGRLGGGVSVVACFLPCVPDHCA